MLKTHRLRALVNERLSTAADEIFALFERTIAEYEEELRLSKEENQRKQEALDSVLSPRVVLRRAAAALPVSSLTLLPHAYEITQSTTASVQFPSVRSLTVPDVIKEEPEEQRVKQEEELQVLVPEFSGVYLKPEDSSLFEQRQTEPREDTEGEDIRTEGDMKLFDSDEGWRAPFSCSEADGDRYSQVQIRARSITAPNSGLFPKYQKSAPATSATVDNGDMSGTADGAERKKHQCSICLKRFARNRNLKIHLRLHSGERPHSCSFCNKTFAQIAALKYHLVTHTGEVPLSCPVCDKGFRISSHLKAHMTTHTGEKPYSCSFCMKSFSQKTHLTVHQRIHTGEKPFSCSLCDRTFLRAEGLRSHMATHR
ncbi:zinc finger protein 90-like [Periophthalmus magnuspinnatus]|uniref:zinc finger protein 90-like n=1 Tax=Periophthalmus magnuspinnatus TaxID=409849 RepID=UPI00145B7754|nr:zinc finger protein 90-like [Periophthalmus magnuspinnatus]